MFCSFRILNFFAFAITSGSTSQIFWIILKFQILLINPIGSMHALQFLFIAVTTVM